ncbi:MAG: GntR family transcriptional regulator [Hyphomicrobiaceae bacterium]|uniref:GntR family transcriptional regulator n=1 Tax=Pseudorhodoplanes sp. TaxID=1934341 RepID=UPI003D0A751F
MSKNSQEMTTSGSSSRIRTTLPARIADQLRARILSGELREGAQLRQEGLASDFSVSRIPVREALRQLEAEGLVVSIPHRGAVVSEISVAAIAEVFELRALIECDLLRVAMPKLTDEHLARADNVNRQSYVPKEMAKVPDWGDLNWQFHSALYVAADRPITLEVLRQLHWKALRYVRLHMIVTGGISRARQDHRRLVELCAERKMEEGISFLREHILNAGRDLMAGVKNSQKNATG